MMKTDADN